ncbi:MAG: ATP-binding protein [Leptonema sp. (in: bacteria)]
MKHILDDIKADLEKSAPHYGIENCPICNGLGFVLNTDILLKDEVAYKICDCVEKITKCDGKPPYEYYDSQENCIKECPSKKARLVVKRIEYLLKNSGIPNRYKNKLFTSIDSNFPKSQNFLFVVDHAYALIKEYKNKNSTGLYMYGGTGSGKTLLSCIILNELIRLYQIPVRYAKISRDILGKIRDTFNPQSEYFGEGRKIEEELANVPVLVIDDFGVQKESPWVNNVLYDLIDSRYEKDLLTILTSNEPMESWKEISNGRVYSRLKEMCLEIHLDAEDYRLKKARSIR